VIVYQLFNVSHYLKVLFLSGSCCFLYEALPRFENSRWLRMQHKRDCEKALWSMVNPARSNISPTVREV
jgi:hypothetical protein